MKTPKRTRECPTCSATDFARYHRKNRIRQLKHTIAQLKERERKRAVLDLTEWQRAYLAECIIQGEIEDKETWLECEKETNSAAAGYIECRLLDALRKLKFFLLALGYEEGGRP